MELTLNSANPTLINEQLEHQRLTSLINSMADAVIAVDENIKIVLYNGAALNIFDVNNITADSALEKLCKPINSENQPVDLTAIVKSTKVPTTNRDLRLPYADGSTINLYISIAPVHLGYGEKGQSGYVLLFRDITREKSLEEERDEFISVVSHELRTPITISEGNLSNAQLILSKGGDISAIKQALEEAHDQVIFLADMINDLSTLSRAEQGKLEVAVESINVTELCQKISAEYTPQAAANHLEFRIELDPKLEILYSSQLYVKEILQNFVTNAIKYSEKGGVTLGAKPSAKGVEFSVTDTGIGISKGDQKRVFDKFFRSEDFRTRKVNGTGLGLYVTMKLARLIHAEINLSSELGVGSTFTINIPTLR